MSNASKPIELSLHARQQLSYRGTSEEEVIQTIRNASWGRAELGRLDARQDFTYNQTWNGKHYKTKQVRPVFVEEANQIVVVTVYVYYF